MVNIGDNCLSISTWNINGLEYKSHGIKMNKLHDLEICEVLKQSECIGLLETHADSNTEICLPGYNVFRKDRPKHRKAWKSSGGIAVFVKESLRSMFKFEPISDSDIIWVRVQKELTKLLSDLYVAFVYLPPFNSSYGKANGKAIMQKLEKQIEYFSCKGKVILTGDLNARVGNETDILIKENDPHLPIPNDNIHEYILPRVTSDSYVNQYGKWLTDLCVDNQLYILNGRTLGDLMGKFTCHTHSGSSIVDYFIASSTLSTDVQSMFVNGLSLLSDHCMLTLKLKVSNDSLPNDIINSTEYGNMTDTHIPDVFVWSSVSKTKYLEAFNLSEVKMKIKNLNKALTTGKVEDAEPLVQSVTDVMVTAGNLS